MEKYYGFVKNERTALALAVKLEKTGLSEAIDAARMLRKNWRYIAARPALQPNLLALAESGPKKIIPFLLSRRVKSPEEIVKNHPDEKTFSPEEKSLDFGLFLIDRDKEIKEDLFWKLIDNIHFTCKIDKLEKEH